MSLSLQVSIWDSSSASAGQQQGLSWPSVRCLEKQMAWMNGIISSWWGCLKNTQGEHGEVPFVSLGTGENHGVSDSRRNSKTTNMNADISSKGCGIISYPKSILPCSIILSDTEIHLSPGILSMCHVSHVSRFLSFQQHQSAKLAISRLGRSISLPAEGWNLKMRP